MKKSASVLGRFKRSLQMSWPLLLGILVGPMLLSSCVQEQVVSPAENQSQNFTLNNPSEWVTVKGEFGEGEGQLEPGEPTERRRAPQGPSGNRGRFNITLKYLVPVTPAQEAVFEEAAARWESIIVQDVPSFTGVIPSAFQGFPPAVDGTVDDVLIEVVLAPIDGPFGILGQAGPQFVRTSDFLTLTGVMFFDVADLAFLDQLDLFEEVIVHEMGHVLGIGTLWNAPGRNLRQGSSLNPFFAGTQAGLFWRAEGGTGLLPIESDLAGPGTGLSHWSEAVLDNELMTGFLNLGENPLSRITAASMSDLGWGAAPVGDNYDLPRGAPGVDPATLSAQGAGGINIGAMEVTLLPIGSVVSN